MTAPAGPPRPVPHLEPTLALALALRAAPGAYALLLGSGVSRAAAIPTGWGIVIDLLRRIAPPGTDTSDAGLEAWYRAAHGGDPDYSTLLEAVAREPAERRERLRGYFEPTPEEREDGRKTPTRAHRAVARLAARGYVRVVLTTNFDQLLETALRDEGVTPAVISTPDAVAGAVPLQHERVTVVKLHGDYTDTRIKNTPAELAAYHPAMDGLLDRVLDEYGLVVCGWSAEWDDALRAAITRAPSRRFSAFWATKGPLGAQARRLAELRHATVVEIDAADAFFEAVEERVASLEDLDARHPVSIAVAVASLKRHLATDAGRIRAHDLALDAADAVRSAALADRARLHDVEAAPAAVLAEVARFESRAEALVALLATGGYWGTAAHDETWGLALGRASDLGDAVLPGGGGRDVWNDLRYYPATLALYASSMAAAAAGRWPLVRALLTLDVVRFAVTWPAALRLNPASLMSADLQARALGHANLLTPLNERVFRVLRAPLRDVYAGEDAYAAAFDRFEYLLALVCADLDRAARPRATRRLVPVGRFERVTLMLNGGDPPAGEEVARVVDAGGLDAAGRPWPPLAAGLFGGSTERLQQALADVRARGTTLTSG
jgi:hypothetical protein